MITLTILGIVSLALVISNNVNWWSRPLLAIPVYCITKLHSLHICMDLSIQCGPFPSVRFPRDGKRKKPNTNSVFGKRVTKSKSQRDHENRPRLDFD
jgi:hypothetical protein